MKKFLIFLLILAMVPIIALADLPDISGLTYDELVELKNQIDSAIWASDGWQSVTVPTGLYKIGKDIPAGKWHISLRPDADTATLQISIGKTLQSNMNSVDIYDPLNESFCTFLYPEAIGGPSSIDLTLVDGLYIEIYASDAVFTPCSGLGFIFK